MSFTPGPSVEEVSDAHRSDAIFPKLGEDVRPFKFEWNDQPGYLTTMCGCMVEVWPGDTVWALPTALDQPLTVVAIDPVTVH